MAARSIASLTISFGMVSIPVKLYSATEASKAISFNLLHKACGSRLKQQYLCVKEEVVVPREDMVKGYEFAKDQYVMFSPEELKAMEEVGTHSAEITEFVPLKTAELKLAQQLIEQQSSEKFDPAAYKDEVRERIEAAVQKKVEGQEITLAEVPETGAQVIDLMEALRASLEKKPKAETRKPPKRAQQAEPATRKAAKK